MNMSILQTVKRSLGVDDECEAFDPELLIYINAAFSTLWQYGIESESIKSYGTSWLEAFGEENIKVIDLIKEYTCIKVRLAFDPPTIS